MAFKFYVQFYVQYIARLFYSELSTLSWFSHVFGFTGPFSRVFQALGDLHAIHYMIISE